MSGLTSPLSEAVVVVGEQRSLRKRKILRPKRIPRVLSQRRTLLKEMRRQRAHDLETREPVWQA